MFLSSLSDSKWPWGSSSLGFNCSHISLDWMLSILVRLKQLIDTDARDWLSVRNRFMCNLTHLPSVFAQFRRWKCWKSLSLLTSALWIFVKLQKRGNIGESVRKLLPRLNQQVQRARIAIFPRNSVLLHAPFHLKLERYKHKYLRHERFLHLCWQRDPILENPT